jgi:hypothetical protein
MAAVRIIQVGISAKVIWVCNFSMGDFGDVAEAGWHFGVGWTLDFIKSGRDQNVIIVPEGEPKHSHMQHIHTLRWSNKSSGV